MAMAANAMDSTLSIFRQRCVGLNRYQDEHQMLLNDMMKHCELLESTLSSQTETLQRELFNCRLDLDDARTSRRNLQQQIQLSEARLQHLTKENDEHKNRHPYVAVLVDGDGLLFHEDFVNDGMEGGKRAAQALRDAVATKCGSLPSKIEIVVKVCANQAGLATAMKNAGSIGSENLFKQFTLGFTQAKASFDFIDVGFGKERADSKIREDARWHLNNVNCQLVVLGISHDSGYAPFLDELSSDRETRQRLRILEGSPAVRELVATGVEVVNFNDSVFRSDKLQVDRVSSAAATRMNGNGVGVGVGRKSPVHANTTTNCATRSDETKEKAAAPLPASSPATKSPTAPVVSSYASATTSTPPAAPPPALKFPTATTKSLQAKAAAAASAAAALVEKSKPSWSPGERGLDPPVLFNPVAVDNVKKRRGPDKFCNVFVITGSCPKDYCEYNHKLKITPDEKKALTFLMRQSPCTYGQDCTMEGCIYGHNCPSVRDGQCMQPFCRFPSSLHPPKTKFKQPYFGDD
ncbi:hypothetical protein SCUCBS95973_000474 [Sporothrix curviconia]|uniref:C3H1-type domain-containing protein n=1 Tax=Sporothrix curviconia TaxID=1260050 RepID=A0ABP0AQP6_9PEZI